MRKILNELSKLSTIGFRGSLKKDQVSFEFSFLKTKNKIFFCLIGQVLFWGLNLKAESYKKDHPPLSLIIKSDPWCPYSCEVGENPGFIIELLQLFFKKESVQIKYENMNWARALLETSKGKTHAVAGCGKQDGDFLFPDIPQARARFSFWGLKDLNWHPTPKNILEKGSVGVVTGYAYDTQFQKKLDENPDKFFKASGEDPLKDMVDMALKKRLKAIYEEDQVFKYFLSKNPQYASQFERLGGEEDATQDLYICFSKVVKEAPYFLKVINEGMKNSKLKPEIEMLKKKYGITIGKSK